VWGGWLSKKPFQKELAMHRLTFDPGQRQVLLLVFNKTLSYVIVICAYNDKFNVLAHPTRGMQDPRTLLLASVFVTSK
jgi:hypothetical protein